MKTVLIKNGFVCNKQLIRWEHFYEVLNNGLIEQKSLLRIQKKIRDSIDFTLLSIEQGNNLKEVAEILGLKIVNNDRTLKTNILKKIKKYESS